MTFHGWLLNLCFYRVLGACEIIPYFSHQHLTSPMHLTFAFIFVVRSVNS